MRNRQVWEQYFADQRAALTEAEREEAEEAREYIESQERKDREKEIAALGKKHGGWLK